MTPRRMSGRRVLATCLLLAAFVLGTPVGAQEVVTSQEVSAAHRLVRQGRLVEAIAIFETLNERDPADANVARGYAGALRQLGRYDEALRVYARADGGRERPLFLLDRVRLLKQLDRRGEAMDVCLASATGDGPPLDQFLLDEVIDLCDDPALLERAHTKLDAVYKAQPTEALGAALIEVGLRGQHYDEAVTLARRLDAQAGTGGVRRFEVARRLERDGQLKLALDLVTEVEKQPGESYEDTLLRARLEETLGRSAEAYATLTKLAGRVSGGEVLDINLRRAHLLAGSLAQPKRALAMYDSLLADPRLRPRFEDVRLERAETQVRLGLWQGAVEDLRDLAATSRKEPTRERAQFLVGEVFFHAGEIDSAAAAFTAQVEAFPTGALANDALDRIYLFNENYGDVGQGLRELGQVVHLEAMGEQAKAVTMARTLETKVRHESIHDDVLWKLACLLSASSDPRVAIACVDSLAAVHPESRLVPPALKLKGEILEGVVRAPAGPSPAPADDKTGLPVVPDRAAALKTYEALLDRYPESIEAAEVRPRVSLMRKGLPS